MAIPADRPPLDPFVFPSETRGRFRMLFAAAMVMAVNLGFQVSHLTLDPGREESNPAQEVWTEIAGDRSIHELKREEIRELAQRLPPLIREQLKRRLKSLLPPAAALFSLTGGTILIYLTHPQRLRRRHASRPLTEERAPILYGHLRSYTERLGLRGLTFEYSEKGLEGQAFGPKGRETLLLFGKPEHLQKLWSTLVSVIAVHEMGHIVNRDAQEREKARAVWTALVSLLGAALLGLGAWSIGRPAPLPVPAGGWRDFLLHNVWRFVALLLVVRSIWAGLIRVREFYADWRVVSWGYGSKLRLLLTKGSRTGTRRSLFRESVEEIWRLHPSHDLRHEMTCRPDWLFRISPGLAFVTGILITLLVSNLVLPLRESWTNLRLLATWGSWSEVASMEWASVAERNWLLAWAALRYNFPIALGALVILGGLSYLITGTLGTQVQRDAAAGLAAGEHRDWGYLRLFRPALFLALGSEVGFLIAPFHPVVPVFFRLAIAPLWLAGITLLIWLWLAYVHALTRFTMGLKSGAQAPRRLSAMINVAAIALLSILFWPAILWRLTMELSGGAPPAFLASASNPPAALLSLLALPALYFTFFAGAVYLLWGVLSLAGAALYILGRRGSCPTCKTLAPGGFAIGTMCEACNRSLTPWIFAEVKPIPGITPEC